MPHPSAGAELTGLGTLRSPSGKPWKKGSRKIGGIWRNVDTESHPSNCRVAGGCFCGDANLSDIVFYERLICEAR